MNKKRSKLASEHWDLLIIGGGIVGAGIARDAAMRGLKTVLIDKHDFAFGTSGRSSRFLHGGIRYLAQGKLQMVREASREKMTLARIAPHLCQPMRFTFPAYTGGAWPLWQLGIGVKIYDWMCGGNFGPSRKLSRKTLRKEVPGLNPHLLSGAVQYFDAFTNDARLVLDNLRSAARHGAVVRNYCGFESVTGQAGDWRCRVHDTRTNQYQELQAKQIVNATGAWSPTMPNSRIKLHPTKGVHLVINAARLPVDSTVVLPSGKRILFAIPWGDRTVLGTTDTDYDGPLDTPDCTAEDIAYILDVANQIFPEAELKSSDVISTWSGLRPLIAGRGDSPSDISRRHEILMSQPGWWDVAGGKLTTYRLIAEQTLDRIIRHAGFSATPCETAEQALLDKDHLLGYSDLLPPPVKRGVVEHYCKNEWAIHLDDIMIRRTKWAYYEKNPKRTAEQVRTWMEEILK